MCCDSRDVIDFCICPINKELSLEKMKQVLVVLICFSVFILLQAADPVSKARDCCRRYSKRIPCTKNIQDYKEQDPSCTKNAVLFMVKDKWICLNPKNKKVKQLVETFSQKKSG